jgi:membrane associated rhomboid family serine protease
MLFFLAVEVFITVILSVLRYPLPLNDHKTVRYRSIPWATFLLIFVNCAIFAFWQSYKVYAIARVYASTNFNTADSSDRVFVRLLNDAADDFYAGVVDDFTYGYRTTTLQQEVSIGAFVAFTSMFMHGNFSHLFGNMLYLWTFGRRVEDACGSWRFLIFYLSCGLIAGVGSALIPSSDGDIPGIGASGAIAGILGGFLLLFPGASITCVWGIGLVLRTIYWGLAQIFGFSKVEWSWTVRLPAFLLLGSFALTSILATNEVIRGGSSGGIGHVAHLSGFLGALIIFLFVRKDMLARYFSGRSV